jgi:hypothetical protein
MFRLEGVRQVTDADAEDMTKKSAFELTFRVGPDETRIYKYSPEEFERLLNTLKAAYIDFKRTKG